MVLPLTGRPVTQCINKTASPVIQERLFVFKPYLYYKNIQNISFNTCIPLLYIINIRFTTELLNSQD